MVSGKSRDLVPARDMPAWLCKVLRFVCTVQAPLVQEKLDGKRGWLPAMSIQGAFDYKLGLSGSICHGHEKWALVILSCYVPLYEIANSFSIRTDHESKWKRERWFTCRDWFYFCIHVDYLYLLDVNQRCLLHFQSLLFLFSLKVHYFKDQFDV